MNFWEDGAEKSRIIGHLRSIDCDVATLMHCSRELPALGMRIMAALEALYKWDTGGGTRISGAEAPNGSFARAATARLRSEISRENMARILREFGFAAEGQPSPLEFHIAAQEGEAV